MSRILLIEDDEDLSFITKCNLESMDYVVEQAYDCKQALEMLNNNDYNILLLDYMLPDMDGTQLCSIIREKSQVPIIFISCIDDNSTIIKALNTGADDYVTKPVDFQQLSARIEANIRRAKGDKKLFNSTSSTIRSFKEFTVDTERHKVKHINGNYVELSPTEYSLLLKFIDSPGELLLYNELYSSIWESDSLGDVRTVMVHISNLRKKIDLNKVGLIETVRGSGYIFNNIN